MWRQLSLNAYWPRRLPVKIITQDAEEAKRGWGPYVTAFAGDIGQLYRPYTNRRLLHTAIANLPPTIAEMSHACSTYTAPAETQRISPYCLISAARRPAVVSLKRLYKLQEMRRWWAGH